MAEYRLARPEEEEQILDFINLVFSMAHQPHDFRKVQAKEYAKPGFARDHFVAADNGRIRGVVGLLPLDMRLGQETLKLGFVGSVSAHPYDKGAGHMKGCMHAMLESARESSYDLLALGGQRQRYQYFGFEKGGIGMRFTVTRTNARHSLANVDESQVSLRKIVDPADPALEAVYALSQAQLVGCQRPRERFWDWMHCENAEILAVETPDGKTTGYIHMRGTSILEMALEDEEMLPAVLKALLKLVDQVAVKAQDYQRRRIEILRSVCEHYGVNDSLMVQVFHWEKVLGALLRFKASYLPLAEGRRVIQIGQERFALEVKAGQATVAATAEAADKAYSSLEAVSALFSPCAALLETDPLLRDWLPLPLDLNDADHF